MVFVFDLNGTITGDRFDNARTREPEPNLEVIAKMVLLKAEGHTIIISTGRKWSKFDITRAWLDKHSVPYDSIAMGKASGDFYVDVDAIRPDELDDFISDLEDPDEKPESATPDNP